MSALRNTLGMAIAFAAALGPLCRADDAPAPHVAPEDVAKLLSQLHGNKVGVNVAPPDAAAPALPEPPVALTNPTAVESSAAVVTPSGGSAPQIQSVHPSPVAGSIAPQILTIDGANFQYRARINLRNRTTGQIYANRAAISRAGSRIVLSANLGNRAADWGLEIVNPDGQTSGELGFQVVPTARTAGPEATARRLAASSAEQTNAAEHPGVAPAALSQVLSGMNAAPESAGASLPAVPVPQHQSSSLPTSNVLPYPSKAVLGAGGAGAFLKAPTQQSSASSIAQPPNYGQRAIAVDVPIARPIPAYPIPAATEGGGMQGFGMPAPQSAHAIKVSNPVSQSPAIPNVNTPPAGAYSVGAGNAENVAVDPPMEYGGSRSMTAMDQLVRPEITTAVVVSNRDVNRIACEDGVEDAFWSKERPVMVNISGSNVFVKFLIKKLGDKFTFIEEPVDLHIVCGDAVYTMVLHPQQVDSVTVRLVTPVSKTVKKIAKDWSALPLEDKIQRFTVMVYKNDFPEGFQRKPIYDGDARRHVQLYDAGPADGGAVRGVSITGQYEVTANGTGLTATEYSVVPDQAREFTETDFLSAQFGDVVAVTVDPARVDAGQPARLIIVTRSVEHGS